MIKTVKYQLRSVCPMLHHNGLLADPANPFAKESKKITSKRTKTDSDLEELARLEFYGGIYITENDGPVIPADCLQATLIGGARKFREGKVAESVVFCTGHAVMEYEGPRTIEELWADERFIDQRMVKVNTGKIKRTRPIFNEWTAIAEFDYDDELVNVERIDEWITRAGLVVGVGDYRPRYGRFTAEKITE